MSEINLKLTQDIIKASTKSSDLQFQRSLTSGVRIILSTLKLALYDIVSMVNHWTIRNKERENK